MNDIQSAVPEFKRASIVRGVPGRFPPLPRDTAYVAKMTFGSQSIGVMIGDHAEQLLAELDLSPLDSAGTQLWLQSVCLLMTVMQYLENLPDHSAADATRTRPDWKHALHLPVRYPGFYGNQLCEFRRQLWQQPAARQVLQEVLDRLVTLGLPATDAEQVLEDVCAVSRLERLIEAMHLVLEAVAATAPDWLRTITRPHWYERYHRQQLTYTLPRSRPEQLKLARAIDADAIYLLQALAETKPNPDVVATVQDLWQEWDQQFIRNGEQLDWRDTRIVCSTNCGVTCMWRVADQP